MSSTSEKVYLDDVIIQEGAREFNREAKTIDIANNAEITVGEMLQLDSGAADYEKLTADADAVVLCLENFKNTSGAEVRRTIPVLYRGGAGLILNYDNISGHVTTKATAVAALVAALGGDDNCQTRTQLS